MSKSFQEQMTQVRVSLFGPAPVAKKAHISRAVKARVKVAQAHRTMAHVNFNSVTVRIA